MGSFICYLPMTKAEVKKNAVQTKKDLKKWFKDHPERTDCDAEMWYGNRCKIGRKTFNADFKVALDVAISKSK
jgi:hypothetical protein